MTTDSDRKGWPKRPTETTKLIIDACSQVYRAELSLRAFGSSVKDKRERLRKLLTDLENEIGRR